MSRQGNLTLRADNILDQIRKSIETKRGLIDEDTLKEYDDMKLIPRSDARAAMADRLVNSMSTRLSSSWPVLYECLELIRDYEIYKQPEYLAGPPSKPFSSFEEYFQARLGQSYDLFVELEETYKFAQEFNKNWFNKSYKKVVKLSQAQKLASKDSLIKTMADAAAAEGKPVNRTAIGAEIKSHRTTVSRSIKRSLNKSVQSSSIDNKLCTPQTKEQIAAEKGISRQHLHMLDKIAEHPDLQERIGPNADKRLSIARAYSIVRRREGKIIDPIEPLKREFAKIERELEKLDESDQKRFSTWAVERLGSNRDAS